MDGIEELSQLICERPEDDNLRLAFADPVTLRRCG